MDDTQVMHAMGIDDAYHVERTLARGPRGVTELVTLDGAGPFVRKKIPAPLANRDVWAAVNSSQCARLPRVEATYELPDRFVVVLDYVQGPTLDEYVAASGGAGTTRRGLRADEAATLACQVCEAARELHRLGVVHRDITPSNVIVAGDGAHLIDLGIARMASRHPSRIRDTTALGTYGFASPEQYGFARTDARSDVYSIGRLLGFMLTGAYPDDDAYGRGLADDLTVPPRLRSVIDRACAFEPSARPADADELARQIAGGPTTDAGGDGGRGRPRPRTTRRHVRGIAAVVAVVAVLATATAIAARSGVFGRIDASTSARVDGTTNAFPRSDAPKTNGGQGTAGDVDTAGLLEIDETGWSVKHGYVHYGVVLRNTSDTAQVDFPSIAVTGRDGKGAVLFADTQVASVIHPGQTLYLGGQAGNGTAPDDVEFSVVTPSSYQVSESNAVAVPFEVTNTSAADTDFGTAFTGEVDTDSSKPSDTSQICLTLILRDDDGVIVYGDSTFVDWPERNAPRPFSMDEPDDLPDYATYEIHARTW